MRKLTVILISAAALMLSCVYFNTFFNAEQGFKRAEKNQRQAAINQAKTNTIRAPRAAPPQEPATSINDKNLYKESIDRANKVITYSPKSKYIDDALWLIGKARYNMGEYISSDKRLSELVTNYPNSKFVDASQYYIGMSRFWLKDYEKALEAFTHITDKKKSSHKDEASYMIAYLDYVQGNFQSSLDEFNKFLKDFDDADSAGSAQFFAGVCLDSLKQYQEARQAYWNVLKHSPPFDLEFDAKYAASLAAFKNDSLSAGMKILGDLAKQPRFFDRSSKLRLRLADGKQLSDSTEEAIKEYEKIVVEFPNTPEAAEANYRLGTIYENQNDFTKAKDYYGKASQGTQDALIRNLAITHSAQISKLENYRMRLGREKAVTPSDSTNIAKSDTLTKPDSMAQTVPAPILPDTLRPSIIGQIQLPPDSIQKMVNRDSLSLMPKPDSVTPDTTQRQAMIGSPAGLPMPGILFDTTAKEDTSQNLPIPIWPPDTTLAARQAPTDSLKLAGSLPDTSAKVDDATIRFLLAELYDQELNRPDSALNEYLLLAEQYPESPYAPKALLAAAFIYESKADTSAARTLYNKIVESYPATIQARFAAGHADSAKVSLGSDVFALYNQAESLYFDGQNPDSAIKIFAYIEQNFPTNEFASKSAYALAWVLDQTLANDGDSSAAYAYQNVVNRYADSPYAYQAKIKLGLIRDTTLLVTDTQIQQNQPADSVYQDSLAQSLTDSLNSVVFALPMAPPVRDTGIFLYPESLLNKKLKGRVTFKIRLDQFGHVSDYQILGPSGELAIDSAATKALMTTTFDMSQMQDLSHLNDYYRFEIKFSTPKLTEFYNPYEQRQEKGP
jgi:TonB family protein